MDLGRVDHGGHPLPPGGDQRGGQHRADDQDEIGALAPNQGAKVPRLTPQPPQGAHRAGGAGGQHQGVEVQLAD